MRPGKAEGQDQGKGDQHGGRGRYPARAGSQSGMFLKAQDKTVFPFFLKCEAFSRKQAINGQEKKFLHPSSQMQPQNNHQHLNLGKVSI
jgi:hypothetical protein